MNINTFENELNPEFVNKARNIYTLARIKNNKISVNGNTYTYNTINNISQVIVDANLNVKSTSCNCRSKYLYCEHTVATFFAIKEYLQKGNTYLNEELTSLDYENFINDLDSINFYNPNKIGEDIKKLCKVIASENNKELYLDYYIRGLMSRYNDSQIYLSMIASSCRQISYEALVALCYALRKESFNLSMLLSKFINNGLHEEILFKLANDLFNVLPIDILDNPILLSFNSFDKVISSLDSDKYIYYNLINSIVNNRLDAYLVNKYINYKRNEPTLLDKILSTILNPKSNYELDEFEVELSINYALKYGFNIEHIIDKYQVNDNFIENSIPTLNFTSLNNNLKLLQKYQTQIKDNINTIVRNDLKSNNSNYLLTSKNLYNILSKIDNISIFELDIENYELILKHIINTYLSTDRYFKIYDKNKYIFFSINNASVYLINIMNNHLSIKKYDYLLDPIDPNESEEIYLFDELENLYLDYLKDIDNQIPNIIKEKKIKQLSNLQNYLLSSLITNEIKYDLEVEVSLATRKKFIKKEPIKLRFKIGSNKFYYIQDLKEFIINVKNNKSQTYGKTTFNLNINNFVDKAKLLISELPSLINNNSIDKDTIINSDFMHHIFETQTQKYIKFNYRNNNYELFISSESINPTININENGVISSPELNDHSIIISGLYYDYLVDFKRLKINRLSYSNDKIKNIIYFLIKNNNLFETEDIKDKFNKTIYPLIYESSKIDDKYLEKNPIKLLEIQCYLDIDDNNVISVESKYYLDNKPLHTLDKLQEEKVNNYLRLLSMLGFNDKNEISDSDLVGDFLKKDLSSLKEMSKVFISEDLQNKKISTFNSYNVYLKQNNNMLKIAFDQSQFTDDELYSILQAYKKKKRYAFLVGKVIEIDEDSAKNLLNIIDDFNLDEKNLSKEVTNPFFNILKVNNYNSLSCFEIEDKLSNIIDEVNNYQNSDFKPNDYLKKVMRPYQIEAFKWLRTLHKYNFGGILADDMGLGKTLETISLLDSINSDLPSIIISPKSLIYNWEKELLKWPTTLIPYVINGNKGERKNILNNNFKPGVVFIISYDTLRNDLELFENKEFNYAILDEAQAIKNMQALKTKSVKKINAMHRLVLTGTPIENSVADLWSIFDFLMPNYLFNYDRFRSEIEKGVLMNDDEAYKRIIIKTKPFILRRKKKDVLKDLPDKIEETISISMSSDQRKLYDAYLMQVRKVLTMRDKNNKITVLSMLTRLRQLCISPSLVVEGNIESEKINYTLDMINNLINTDHKVLIFSQFVSALELIQRELVKNDIPYFIITGDTNSKKRVEMCDEFNKENSNEKVFLISLKAGGTGLNLIGADTVIHLDPWWNVAIEEQASDRAHRIGQQRKVTVFKLIMNNSIEEKVIDLQKNKKEIAERIISNDIDINSLSYEDYDYLLS